MSVITDVDRERGIVTVDTAEARTAQLFEEEKHHKRLAPLMSSRRKDWNTPQIIIDILKPLGPIALDPCSNASSIVPAYLSWSLESDGDSLMRPWCGIEGDEGLVYVNPPYGRVLPRWIEKCRIEAAEGREIVALVPSRTDTRWFDNAWLTSDAVAFFRGRLKFLGAPHPAPFPSALIYWGPRRFEFESAVESRCLVHIE